MNKTNQEIFEMFNSRFANLASIFARTKSAFSHEVLESTAASEPRASLVVYPRDNTCRPTRTEGESSRASERVGLPCLARSLASHAENEMPPRTTKSGRLLLLRKAISAAAANDSNSTLSVETVGGGRCSGSHSVPMIKNNL